MSASIIVPFLKPKPDSLLLTRTLLIGRTTYIQRFGTEVDAGTVRDYPGNYSDYEWKRSREAASVRDEQILKNTDTPSPAKKDKEQKRREAEARNARYRQLKPLKERLQEVERQLETVLHDKQEIETQLADPGLYQDDNKTVLQDILAKQKVLQKEESTLMTEWDDLHTRIESIDNAPTSP